LKVYVTQDVSQISYLRSPNATAGFEDAPQAKSLPNSNANFE